MKSFCCNFTSEMTFFGEGVRDGEGRGEDEHVLQVSICLDRKMHTEKVVWGSFPRTDNP